MHDSNMSIVYGELALLTFVCVSFMVWGLKESLARAGFASEKSKIVGTMLAVIVTWLTFTALLARSGVLAQWDSAFPRLPLIPLTALLSLVLVNQTDAFKKLLAATPRHWPVAMQSFRIFVELCFWRLFAAGGAPVLVTFEGRNFDVIAGITAPCVALAIYKLALRPRYVLVWNVLSLVILANTVFTTLTSQPGRLHIDWPGEPFTAFATWPFVWIPAFLAPLAVFLHVFSIRQNLATPKKFDK